MLTHAFPCLSFQEILCELTMVCNSRHGTAIMITWRKATVLEIKLLGVGGTISVTSPILMVSTTRAMIQPGRKQGLFGKIGKETFTR